MLTASFYFQKPEQGPQSPSAKLNKRDVLSYYKLEMGTVNHGDPRQRLILGPPGTVLAWTSILTGLVAGIITTRADADGCGACSVMREGWFGTGMQTAHFVLITLQYFQINLS